MFDLSMLMAHKQCCVTGILNKRRYTSDSAVFDMFTVILADTFDFLARDSICTYAIARYMLSPVRLSVRHIGGLYKNG